MSRVTISLSARRMACSRLTRNVRDDADHLAAVVEHGIGDSPINPTEPPP